MFKGSNPQAREDAEILNGLLLIWRTTERVEGLRWLLGRREYFAAVSVEPGSPGVRYDAATQTLYLFEVKVLRVDVSSYSQLVKPAMRVAVSKQQEGV
jgi:hypothetical protein